MRAAGGDGDASTLQFLGPSRRMDLLHKWKADRLDLAVTKKLT
jgi:hypothetical protein